MLRLSFTVDIIFCIHLHLENIQSGSRIINISKVKCQHWLNLAKIQHWSCLKSGLSLKCVTRVV